MKWFKKFAVIAATLFASTSMFITAFALTSEEEEWLISDIVSISDTSVTAKNTWVKNWLTPDPDKSDSATPIITIDGTQLYLMSGKTEDDLSKQITQTKNNDKTVGNVTNITDGLNIGADTDGAAAMISGFVPVINIGLGILIWAITSLMMLFTALDVCYIAFPVFRNKCEDSKNSGGMMASHGNNGGGGTKLAWVSQDAQDAVQAGLTDNTKNMWAMYLKKRIVSYIFLSIILFILLTGNISLITNIVLKMVSGIMNVLNGLA